MSFASVIIVSYNNEDCINACLLSVVNQTFINHMEIIVIDNNSTDNTLKIVLENFPMIKLLRNSTNTGFSKGNNTGINLSKGEYIFCFNADVVVDKFFVERAVNFLNRDTSIGALGGKLLKFDFNNNRILNIYDSAGLIISRSRKVSDRGQGEEDTGQYNNEEEVFGVCAAAAVYRRSALEAVKIENEFFDDSFFAYKEDIDISWRIRLAGWKIMYNPECTAYHRRSTGVISNKSGLWATMTNRRRNLSPFIKKLSYKNQRIMQIKNEMLPLVIRDMHYIIIKEVLILGYLIIIEPYLLGSVFELISEIPGALKKRRVIMRKANIKAEEMKRWFK